MRPSEADVGSCAKFCFCFWPRDMQRHLSAHAISERACKGKPKAVLFETCRRHDRCSTLRNTLLWSAIHDFHNQFQNMRHGSVNDLLAVGNL